MNIITTTAFANLKKNKSRNILIGIAIALTAFLLTMLPTMVMGQLGLQFQAVNELYSPVHGVYRNVDEKTAAKMQEDKTFETVGLILEVTEKEFVIAGMIEDTPEFLEKGFYAPMVSEAFAKETIPEGEHVYEVYFQLKDIEGMVTEKIEERIKLAGEQYGLTESDIAENEDYLIANYVDVALYMGLGALLAVIVLAVQILITYFVNMNFRKLSLTDRIRFAE